jgi:endonuclease YncB( thermonuclease family)
VQVAPPPSPPAPPAGPRHARATTPVPWWKRWWFAGTCGLVVGIGIGGQSGDESQATAAVVTMPPDAPLAAPGDEITGGHVVRGVLDGATVALDDGTTVVLAGIESAPVGSPEGDAAVQALSDLVLGRTVIVDRVDAAAVDRVIGHVLLGDALVAEQLAASGWARLSGPTGSATYDRRIAEAQTQAQNAAIGVWTPTTVTEPPTTTQAATTTQAPTTMAPPPVFLAPPANDDLDPRFDTCRQALANGYGNYRRGEDPEYDWYRDADSDGIVCE